MLSDASCVAAGGERSRAGLQPCWQECQAPRAFRIFLHTKAQMFKVLRCKDIYRCGTCACKYPICEHNWNYAGIIQVCSTSILLGNLSSGVLLCLLLFCCTAVWYRSLWVEKRQSHGIQISKALKKNCMLYSGNKHLAASKQNMTKWILLRYFVIIFQDRLPGHLANSWPSTALTHSHLNVLLGQPSWGHRSYLPALDQDLSPVFGCGQHQLLQHKVWNLK